MWPSSPILTNWTSHHFTFVQYEITKLILKDGGRCYTTSIAVILRILLTLVVIRIGFYWRVGGSHNLPWISSIVSDVFGVLMWHRCSFEKAKTHTYSINFNPFHLASPCDERKYAAPASIRRSRLETWLKITEINLMYINMPSTINYIYDPYIVMKKESKVAKVMNVLMKKRSQTI